MITEVAPDTASRAETVMILVEVYDSAPSVPRGDVREKNGVILPQ